MTSPYIAHEAARLRIGAEYRASDFVTPRERQDRSYRDIERSEPVESWGSGIIQCAGFVGLLIIVWVVLGNLAQAWELLP